MDRADFAYGTAARCVLWFRSLKLLGQVRCLKCPQDGHSSEEIGAFIFAGPLNTELVLEIRLIYPGGP